MTDFLADIISDTAGLAVTFNKNIIGLQNLAILGDAVITGDAAVTGNLAVTGGALIAGNTEIAGNLKIDGNAVWASSIVGTTKTFDISHPSKPDMRLRYGCLEGPEHAVYLRGKTTNPVITLPDYWVDLVDLDTITIQLTATSPAQQLYVQDIRGTEITIFGDKLDPYYYYIMAERKDVPKLITEYNA